MTNTPQRTKPDVRLQLSFPYALLRRLGDLPNVGPETLGDKIFRVFEVGIEKLEQELES
jgi:hypothetical protein